MTCNFGDGFVVDHHQRASGSLDIHFVEDVPLSFFLSHFCAARHCFFWSFCFGSRAQYQSLHSSLSQGTGFGPVVLYYNPADGNRPHGATPTQSRGSEQASGRRPSFDSAEHDSVASRPYDAVDLGESITTTWEGAGFTRTLDTFFSRHLQNQLATHSPTPPPGATDHRRGSAPSWPHPKPQPLPHTASTFRNLTVLTWVVNDLPHSVGSASVVGPGPHDKGNAEELSAAGVEGLLVTSVKDSLAPEFARHDSTVVAGLPDFSPALLFQSSVPQGKHTRLVETYDGTYYSPIACLFVSLTTLPVVLALPAPLQQTLHVPQHHFHSTRGGQGTACGRERILAHMVYMLHVFVLLLSSYMLLCRSTLAGAVWRSTSTELVEIAPIDDGADSSTNSTVRYRRQRVSREWTIHFANGPFQEVYLSEVPAVVQSSILPPGSSSCREAAACKLYGHSPQQSGARAHSQFDKSTSDGGGSGHILGCEVLQADVDALAKLVRNGHYATLIHLDGHTERSVSDLCPCSCPAQAASTALPDTALEELDRMINNLTLALESADATVSLERHILQLRTIRRKRALFDELQSASLRGDSREQLRAEFLAVSQEAREASQVTPSHMSSNAVSCPCLARPFCMHGSCHTRSSSSYAPPTACSADAVSCAQKTTATELRDAIFSGVIAHTEALTKKQQLVTLMQAMRRAHALSPKHSADPFNVFSANLSSVTVSSALLDDHNNVEMLAQVLLAATH